MSFILISIALEQFYNEKYYCSKNFSMTKKWQFKKFTKNTFFTFQCKQLCKHVKIVDKQTRRFFRTSGFITST